MLIRRAREGRAVMRKARYLTVRRKRMSLMILILGMIGVETGIPPPPPSAQRGSSSLMEPPQEM